MTQATATCFQNNLEHILERLGVMDLRLALEVRRAQERNSALDSFGFQGLMVSDNDVAVAIRARTHDSPPDEEDSALRVVINKRSSETAERARASLELNVDLRLETLRRRFDLTDADIDILVLCVAPEIDPSYETLYSYIQNDVSLRKPTVNLVLNLFTAGVEDRIAARNHLVEKSGLTRWGLVDLDGDRDPHVGSFSDSPIRIDPRTRDFILGIDEIDNRIAHMVELRRHSISLNDLVLGEDVVQSVDRLSSNFCVDRESQKSTVVVLMGAPGTGKKSTAEVVCASLGLNLLVVDIPNVQHIGGLVKSNVSLMFKEAALQNAAIYLDRVHQLFASERSGNSTLTELGEATSTEGCLIFVGTEVALPPELDFGSKTVVSIELSSPDFSERRKLWEDRLQEQSCELTSEEIDSIAGRFRLNGGQIRNVVESACIAARFDPRTEGVVRLSDLNATCRRHSDQRIGKSATKITPMYRWDDIVLPPDQRSQLEEICNYFENRALVYEHWGFQRKTTLGKGLNAMFAGQSGTGKTMSADIMASQLELDLYKIDLSGVVSKYIGETEKNLDRIFTEAQDSNAILFFDEADALFGKRSEVKDSHDRYANIEISYLLQKMDEYQGIVILATNFRKNMDDAFVRRMHFAIEFPMPEESDRLEIWRRVFPDEAPLADDVDLAFAARQFKVAGGNIKNMAVTSAFLAAQEKKPIDMRHLILATKREYQKMGKLLVENDFAQYFDLVKPKART